VIGAEEESTRRRAEAGTLLAIAAAWGSKECALQLHQSGRQ
jgi:hypothetical protein